MCILTLLILFSRNFLGVHTPQDVIVGGLLGAAILWLTVRFMSRFGDDSAQDGKILLIVWAAVAAAMVYYLFKPYPMDYVDGTLLVDPVVMSNDSIKSCGSVMGMVLGWYLERRYIRFSVEGSRKQKLLRFAVGTLVLLAVNATVTAAGHALLRPRAALYLHRFVPLVLAMAGVPALFAGWEKQNRPH
jgi:positive regulator of sigma E activity